MVEDRNLAERVTLQMLGHFGFALEHIELHLFELSDALLVRTILTVRTYVEPSKPQRTMSDMIVSLPNAPYSGAPQA